ncbi:serine/threonine-protein kinase/endoribonuclease IRE1a isoform X1 [Punica granatum]|uniref:non-specific serine/threonine protein kinase n=1 Tax=Punica granatum TaxID=22663 RepID=A0A6P8CZM6_PUNGR|nr:serine/threonine-protein kinase/endoribonuclease IRE1a isoform X1 [Punica granatum]
MRVLLVFLTIFLCISVSDSSDGPITRLRDQGLTGLGLPVRSLKSLSPSPNTALVAALDGTIHLMDSDSGRVIWSFASGPPIYSSYQAPVNQDNDTEISTEPNRRFFIDCGDDWELYAHSELGKVKLPLNIDDFIRSTPLISEDDRSITLGSRKSTVFEVDALTGRLLHAYGMPDSPSTSPMNTENTFFYNEKAKDLVESSSTMSETMQHRLKITRIDYILQSFAVKSGRSLWNMTLAEIGAALICHEDENSLDEALANPRLQLGSDSGNPFTMPLSCQSRAIVYRLRNRDIHDSFSRSQLHTVMQLPGPNSRELLSHQPKLVKALPLQPENIMLPHPDYLLRQELHDDGHTAVMLPLPAPESANSGVANRDLKIPFTDVSSKSVGWSAALSLLVVTAIIVGFVYHYARKSREHANQVEDSNMKTPSKKKKPRKPGKSNGSPQSKGKDIVTGTEEGLANSEGEDDAWKKLNKIVTGNLDGRRIGKLFVSNAEIAKGSNGTIVFEGVYEGRPVAVKRLVKAYHDVAIKEIENLIASDRHPNIVRWYGLEFDQDFAYVSLERCTCSLDDLIQIFSDSTKDSMFPEDPSSRTMIEYKFRLNSVRDTFQDVSLWKPNGHPSPLLIKLMRDVVSGLVHLHDLGIIHRDLKPQNVLINKERFICAKLSDMGISRRLHANMSSLGYHATAGCGSSGWQAPEQLLHGRQTRAVDVFSLGCVLFFCITGGRHPFGDRFERDANIVKNKMDLFLVEFIPEAVDLFFRLLNPEPDLRPKALDVLHHPLFWTSELRLSFLRDMSDRVELEDRETESDLLKALEKTAPLALGGKWDEKMEPAFINNIGRYRRYKYDSVRDLLRVMRNKLNHYRELPKEIKELLGPVPEGFDHYFAGRFPKLLIEVYKVACTHCKEEECFQKYFRSEEL